MLKDNILLVGANGSIGHSIKKKLEKDFNIISVVRIRKPSDCHNNTYELDLEDINLIKPLIEKIVKDHGKIKSFIFTAGYQFIKPLKLTSYEDCLKQFNINYFAPVFLSKIFSSKKYHSEDASIVFISSIAANKSEPGIINYSASKSALESFAKGLSIEIKPIRVNCIQPSYLKTPFTEKFPKIYTSEFEMRLDSIYPLGIGDPDDIANTVKFLISNDAKYITGSVINVDGGAANL